MSAIADHLAEADHDRARQRDHQQSLQQVGDRGRVLVGMGGVGVEEAAAIGAKMLDGLHRGDRPQRDRLVRTLDRMRGDAGGQRLRLALLNDHQRQHERGGHQDAGGEADQVAIEIAEIGAAIRDREGADEGHGDDEAGSGGGEHRKGDRRHLAENR